MTETIHDLVIQYIDLSKVGLIEEAEEMAGDWLDENRVCPEKTALFDILLEEAGY